MKIVLGIDDSPCSLAALEYLRQLPWARRAEWHVVSVVQNPVMAYAMPGLAAAEAMQAMELQRTAQREWLAGVDRDLRVSGLTTRATIDEPDPRTALVQATRDDRADLLVVGSHGRTGISRLLLGSVAGHVVVHAPCSVLVVKSTRRPAEGRPMRVLIGVDDAPGSQDVVTFVRGLVWPPDTRFHLLSAVAMPNSRFLAGNSIAERAAREEARIQQELVSRYERQLADAGFAVEAEVPEGDPRVELEHAARRIGADLLVVGSHGRSGLSRMMLGSVAGHLTGHAPCSVLVVKRSRRG